MNEFIRNICIFVCLCDFISQLFLSEKFLGLYRNISGVFIILFLLYPFGRQFIDITKISDQELISQFEENLQNNSQIWDIEADNKKMNELNEESQKLLEQYIQDAVDEYEKDETKTDKFEKDSFDADSFETDSFEVEE